MKTVVRGEDGELVTRKSAFTTEALQPRPADLPVRGAAARRDRRRRHAGGRQLRRPGHRQGGVREAHARDHPPEQPGTWHWISDTEVHYRPKQYWKAGTRSSVDVDINGVDAGNGIYGQEDRQVDFKIGDAHVYRSTSTPTR